MKQAEVRGRGISTLPLTQVLLMATCMVQVVSDSTGPTQKVPCISSHLLSSYVVYNGTVGSDSASLIATERSGRLIHFHRACQYSSSYYVSRFLVTFCLGDLNFDLYNGTKLGNSPFFMVFSHEFAQSLGRLECPNNGIVNKDESQRAQSSDLLDNKV